MVLNIEQDHLRFRQIVRGKIKQDLRKYISHGEMIGKKGKDLVSIPLPQIEMPQFRYGDASSGGVGQGEGESATPLAPGDASDGDGQAGDEPGGHILEVELTLEELAADPRRRARAAAHRAARARRIDHDRTRSSTPASAESGPSRCATSSAPTSEALKRQIASGTYDPLNPSSSRSARTSATAPGRRSRSPRATPSSST